MLSNCRQPELLKDKDSISPCLCPQDLVGTGPEIQCALGRCPLDEFPGQGSLPMMHRPRLSTHSSDYEDILSHPLVTLSA